MEFSKTLKGALFGLAAFAAGLGATAAEAQTIRMWTFLNPAGNAPREKALAEIISKFESANPGVKISVEPQVWDQMTPKFLAAHRAGNAPDIVWVVTDLLGDALKTGSLADLGELFVNKWPAAARDERKDGYWSRCAQGNKVHCLFHSRNYYGVIYRTDFLKEAGVDPAKLTTWPAFIEAAKKLTVKDASGNVVRWGFGQQFSEDRADSQMMTSLMLSRQGDLFDAKGMAKWANATGAEALKLQTDMVTVHGVTPRQAVTWSAEDLYEQFAAGRIAMFTGAVVRISTMQAKVGSDNVGFMIWPGIDGKPHSPAVMAGWAVGVWSGGKNKAMAGKFLEHMSTGESDRRWVEVGGQLPGAPSTLANMKDFTAKPANAYLTTAALGVAKYGWIPSVEYGVGGYRQALNKAAQDVIVGNVDPMAALVAAEKRFNQQNNR
jgi:multiple sugar transport system substrate-binding protein